MEISFIHTQILVHLQVNKTNFHMKGFTLGLALGKSSITVHLLFVLSTEVKTQSLEEAI